MTAHKTTPAYSSSSGWVRQNNPPNQLNPQPADKPPRKPDWLLILVSILILLTLLIAWLSNFPLL